MASSSSSSSTRSWKYDVFLSFRGPDTRKGIANEICNRLSRSGIKTFMDEHGLQVGDVISPALIQAIKESRFAIVILSKNYASSAWCLEELREICLSMKDNRILPLFFEVDPTHVRHQTGSFRDAFSKHDTSGRHESEKVEQWRAALGEVANISGWNTNDFKTHEELVDKIVESLRSKVPPDAIELSKIGIPNELRISYMVGKSQDNQGVANLNASESLASSSEPHRWKYDVFLSFRGTDTRKGIANEICNRLGRSGIKMFMDEQGLEVGDVISPTLIQAIKESRFAIVILSQNYASSDWCLEELREICQSMEGNRILPFFYHVDPTDVRYQKRSFEEAFSKHDTSHRHELKKVNQWRADLYKVANISGWNTNDFKTHEELVDNIVESLRSIVPLDDFQAFGATKEATDKVMKALTDDKITAVGVYGMGGVGKTSMVRHVAAQACRNGTFNHWIMAVVSQNLDLEKVQGTLADLLGFKFVEETEAGRATKLHKEIMGKKKLLIILDDVWDEIELSKIGIPGYKELQTCNSKVLVTTRKINVCHAMKCTTEHGQVSIPLNILSDEDALALFRRNAGIFESTTFEEVVKRVAGECKGLPIALIAVARALRDEDQEEWEKAAERLKLSQYVNPNYQEDEENAFRCIRLSYDYLKNEDHKSCFLLCCLFPEDHDIEIEEVFRYTIGKRLFRDAETMEEARGRLVTVVKYLKNSSLLLDSQKKGCVKMRDVIRDTALNIAQSEEGHRFFVKAARGLKDWAPWGLHEGCTAISLMNNKIRKLPEEELVCPNLQILLLNGNYELSEIPEKFIQNLKEFRVLDLSNTSISVLPQSFSLLTNLQALYLDRCDELIDISVVGKLNKLEILSMRDWPGGQLSREI